MDQDPISDAAIAAELAQRGLELIYLQELAASLGFADDEGWTDEVFTAIEGADLELRRRAALRTLGYEP